MTIEAYTSVLNYQRLVYQDQKWYVMIKDYKAEENKRLRSFNLGTGEHKQDKSAMCKS